MLHPPAGLRLIDRHRALPHQVEAVHATKNLEYAALFHKQGLGKTKMALDLILYWIASEKVDSALVVTKKALVENWTREVQHHTHIRPIIIGQDRRSNFFAFNRPGRLYISHYEVISSERNRFELFAKARRIGTVLDESQRIKNPNSRAAKALHALAPHFVRRVIMSGTPVANRPYDVWSQIYFLDQGESLGSSYSDFKSTLDIDRRLVVNSEYSERFESDLWDINKRIGKFTVRKTKESVDLTLPDKTLRITRSSLEHRQRSLYDEYRERLSATITRGQVRTIDDAENVLKRLLRLIQIASNPRLVDHDYSAEPGKLSLLDAIMEDKQESDPKTIIWTNFTENVDMIARRYPRFRPAKVHGKFVIGLRNENIRRFINDLGCRLLVATPGAAKEGHTLTVANHAIFFDRTFSLDDYLQAQDRIHRISQTKPCLVETIVASDTVDEWVEALISAKQLAAALAQGDLDLGEYRSRATYSFNEIIREILSPVE